MDETTNNNTQQAKTPETVVNNTVVHTGPTEKFWNRLGAAAIVLASLGGIALMVWASSGH